MQPLHISGKLHSSYLSLNFSPATAAVQSWFLPTPPHQRTATAVRFPLPALTGEHTTAALLSANIDTFFQHFFCQ